MRIRRRFLLATLLISVALAPPPLAAQARDDRPHDSWFGSDKIKHFLISAFIESVTFSGLRAAGVHRNASFAGAIGVTSIFGIGKEIHDKQRGEPFSLHDIAWDAAGGGSAFLMLRHTQH
jgi:putative lipoprotein